MRRQNTVQIISPIGYLCYLCLLALTAALLPAFAFADPMLPTIPSGTFTVPAATGIAATDTANLKATLTAAGNSRRGGTVIVPSGTYLCNTFSIPSNVNLQLSSGANIQNATPLNTLISISSGHDIAITGSGTIDGRATTTKGSSNLVVIYSVTNLLVSGVTICNSSHFHLVPANITNMTIDGININDTYTKSMNGGEYLGTPTASTTRAATPHQELQRLTTATTTSWPSPQHLLQRHHSSRIAPSATATAFPWAGRPTPDWTA